MRAKVYKTGGNVQPLGRRSLARLGEEGEKGRERLIRKGKKPPLVTQLIFSLNFFEL